MDSHQLGKTENEKIKYLDQVLLKKLTYFDNRILSCSGLKSVKKFSTRVKVAEMRQPKTVSVGLSLSGY
jgi:hypothetical protein